MNGFWKWITHAASIALAIWLLFFVLKNFSRPPDPPPKWGDTQIDSLAMAYDAQFEQAFSELGVLTVQTDSLGRLSITMMERVEDVDGRLRFVERRPTLKCNEIQIIQGGSYKCIKRDYDR